MSNSRASPRSFLSTQRATTEGNIIIKIWESGGGGSDCDTVDRVVASNSTWSGFESSHRQLLLTNYGLLIVFRKDENKEKVDGMAHPKNQNKAPRYLNSFLDSLHSH